MKIITKPVEIQIPPVKIYLEDLELVLTSLKKTQKEIYIGTEIDEESYSIEDLKQLQKFGNKPIKNLTMNTRYHEERIDFSPSSTSVYFQQDTLENRGIASEITQILEKRKVKLGKFLTSKLGSGLIVFFALVSLLVTMKYHSDESYTLFGIFLIMFVLLVLVLVYSYRLDMKRHSCILPFYKREENTFWKRNQDKIWLSVITTVLTFIFTFVGFLIWGKS